MKRAMATRWWPHEIAFALFLSVTSARLLLCGASGIFLGVIFVALLAAIFFARRWSQKFRLWVYLPLMMACYSLLGIGVPIFHPGPTFLMARADHWLLGRDAAQFLEPWMSGPLTDLFYALYLFFFVYIGMALWDYSKRTPEIFLKFMSGLFTVYGLGFLGYTLLPAAGPYQELAGDFSVPTRGSIITDICEHIVRIGSNRVDCFPCLHFAVSFYILMFDWWHCRRRFFLLLAPCLGIWLATIYIRQHYLVDLFGGLAVSVFALRLTRRAKNPAEIKRNDVD